MHRHSLHRLVVRARQSLFASTLILPVLLFGGTVAAQEATLVDPGPTNCLDCHNGAVDPSSPLASPKLTATSSHASLDCTDCHTTVSMDELDTSLENPHGGAVLDFDAETCGECHEDEAEAYVNHGRLAVDSASDVPMCWHCHGTHDILPSSDRQSHVHTINLPSTCRSCHTNVDLVKKHDRLRDKPIRMYESSVHGQASKKGLYVSATCNDCHSAVDADGKRTAHRILNPADPESTIYHFNIPDTCGQCHQSVTKDYWDGIHGQFVKRGSVDSPVCTHCHGEHGIISSKNPLSPVSSARVAERTCVPCHESSLFREKYGGSGEQVDSYIDQYHGLKSKAGDTQVATCASCHGSHRILSATDKSSSIHESNLQQTCGECHPGIAPELAQTKIHETGEGLMTGWPEVVRRIYIVLIVVTIGGMLMHNGADWIRRVRQASKSAFVQRLSTNEVAQHWVLMISFSVLVISGFSLRFAEAGWVEFLFGWQGGFEVRGIIHRVAAVVMTIGSVWHVLYLLGRRGRQCLMDMLPRMSDVTHFRHNVLFFLGERDDEPRFKRFSYIEKAEYWALAWGTLVMTVTGVMLWFDSFFIKSWGIPKVWLDVALVIHFYEAWLAFLAILVWHVYGVMFKPSVYPMNTAWLSGKMSKHMYEEEHPEGPRLKARTLTVRYEDEEEPDGSDNTLPPQSIERPIQNNPISENKPVPTGMAGAQDPQGDEPDDR